MKLSIIFITICFITISCTTTISTDDNQDQTIIDNSIVEATKTVSFHNDIQPLLDSDCVMCHEYLEYQCAYDSLTIKRSKTDTTKKLIDVENPEQSMFYIKLQTDPPCGSSMGGDWSDEEKALLLTWIKEGAKNN